MDLDFLLDGYFGADLDISETPTIGIICISLMVIGISIQCVIATIAYRHMIKKNEVRFKFKLSFFLLFASSCTFILVCILFKSNFMRSNLTTAMFKIHGAVSVAAYYFFITLLLVILVLRLHVTFSQTQHEMSSAKYHMFIAILVLLFVLTLVFFALLLIVEPDIDESGGIISLDYPDWYPLVTMIIYFVFFFLFLAGSAWAVKSFTSNLGKLAIAQANTPEAECMNSSPSLNRRQQRFIDLSARYMLLFAIATVSSILVFVLGQGFGWKSGIKCVFGAVDCTINLLCVYLQFGFAAAHYQRCCGCLDRRCRRNLSRRTQMNMHETSNSKDERRLLTSNSKDKGSLLTTNRVASDSAMVSINQTE